MEIPPLTAGNHVFYLPSLYLRNECIYLSQQKSRSSPYALFFTTIPHRRTDRFLVVRIHRTLGTLFGGVDEDRTLGGEIGLEGSHILKVLFGGMA